MLKNKQICYPPPSITHFNVKTTTEMWRLLSNHSFEDRKSVGTKKQWDWF